MTMNDENCRIVFYGNGSTTQFSWPYFYGADDELQVALYHVDVDELVILDPVFYQITPSGGGPPWDGCTITCAPGGTPLTANQRLVVVRVTELNQETDLNNQQAYFLEIIESTFDRVVRQQQEERDRTKRMPMVDITDENSLLTDGQLTMSAPEPGEFLRWAEDGSFALTGYPLADFDSQEWIDAWHREYYSQVAEDNLQVEQGWIQPTNANWNGITTPGWYSYLDALNTGMTNTPANLSPSGMLTVSATFSNIHQVYTNSADGSIYHRIHYNGTWTEWEAVGGMIDMGEIDVNVDNVDDATDVGIYYVTSAAPTVPDPVLRGAPPDLSTINGLLSVEESEGHLRQHYSALGGVDAGRSFIRTWYESDGFWSGWRETTGVTHGELEGLVDSELAEEFVPVNYGRIGNTTDWNTLTNPAYWWYDSTFNLGQTNTAPRLGTDGILIVENSSDNVVRQVYTANIDGVPMTSSRAAYYDAEWVWSAWVVLGDESISPEWHVEYYSQVTEDHLQVEKGDLTNNSQNWNNLTTPGWYRYTNINDVAMSNTPPNKGVQGILSVESTDSVIKQIYTHALEPMTTATRTYANGVWTDWNVDATGEYVPGESEWVGCADEVANAGYWWFDACNMVGTNHYFVVGQTGLGEMPPRLARSVDGENFFEIELDAAFADFDPKSVVAIYGRGVILGALFSTGSPMGIYSDNGLDWTWCSNVAAVSPPMAIAYNPGNGYFSAICFSDSANCGVYSQTGEGWAQFSMPSTNLWLRDLEYANGVFVAVGGDNGQASIVRSTYGWGYDLVWFSSGASLMGVAFGNGRWVAVSKNDGAHRIVYSDDNALTWTYSETLPAMDFQDITFRNGLFIAIGLTADYASHIYTSDDGINWELEQDLGLTILGTIVSGLDNTIAIGNGIVTRITTEGSAIDLSASLVPVDTTLFNGVLSAADDNVQKALNTLDDHTHSTADITDFDEHTHTADEVLLPDGWEPDTGGGEVVGEYQQYCTDLPLAGSWSGAARSDSGRIVVVGYLDSANQIYYSDDEGLTWTSAGAPADMDVYWASVAYGNGRFVACAFDSPDHVIAYSDDGITWIVPDTAAANGEYWAVAYGDPGFVAVNSNGDGSNDVIWSSDGETWYMASSGISATWVDICYAQGWFFALGNYGEDGGIFARSSNGAGWYGETTIGAPGTFNAIAANENVIVAVMNASSTQARYSADGGVNWQTIDRTNFASTQQWWYGVAFGDDKFYAVGSRTGYDQVMSSDDGVTWYTEPAWCTGMSWYVAKYLGNKQFLFLSWDSGPGMQLIYEETGGDDDFVVTPDDFEEENFTVTEPAAMEIECAAYGNGVWVIVGSGDYPNDIYYSDDDGATWTLATLPTGYDTYMDGVGFGNGRFIAANGEGTKALMESADGITWTWLASSPEDGGYWWDVDYGNGRWVILGRGPAQQRIMYSADDGATWQYSTGLDEHTIQKVTYWENAGLFVAVGYRNNYTGQGVILTSPDGNTWTLVSDTEFGTSYKSVVAGGDICIAVGEYKAVYSTDGGATWTESDTFAYEGDWRDIAYGNGVFMAVSRHASYPEIRMCTTGNDWAEFDLTGAPSNLTNIAFGNDDFLLTTWYHSGFEGYCFMRCTKERPVGPEPMEVDTPFHAAYIEVYTGNFDNNLMADPELDTVQKCLDFIDDLDLPEGGVPPAGDITVDDTNLDGNLAGIENVQDALDIIDDLSAGTLVIDTTNFDDILSPAETDIQSCLDVLDDHRHPAARITLTTTDFDGILGAGQTNVQLAMDVLDDHGHDTADILPDVSGADVGDVLTWNGAAYVWAPPPSLGSITSQDIDTVTDNFNGLFDDTVVDVQMALDIIDDHTHDANTIGTITSNFDGLFSSTQNTVQKCLDLLDDLSFNDQIVLDTTNFDGVLSEADTQLQHAFDTIDDHTHPSADVLPPLDGVTSGVLGTDGETIYWTDPAGTNIALQTVYFDGVLDDTCVDVQTAMEMIDDHYHVNNVPRCGMVNRDDSALPNSLSTSAFVIGGTYEFYVNGILFEDTMGTVDIGASYGYHYIWYDVDGVLCSSETNYPIDYLHCPVATVMWNGSEGVVFDQRHLSTRNADLAAMMTDTVGARYGDGFDATFTDTTFSIEAGHYWDEDMRYDIAAASVCRIIHRDSTNWTWTDQQAEYYIADAGVLQYDNLGTLVDAPEDSYVAIWLYATADVANGIWGLCGQRWDADLEDARVNNDLPTVALPQSNVEARLLYRVIVQRVGSTPVFVEARDYRKANIVNGHDIVKGDHLYLDNVGTMTHAELEAALSDMESSITGFMEWKGNWVPALYEIGDVVSDDQWTMIAVVETSDRPAPQPVGDMFWVRESVGEPVWENSSSTTNVLYIGQRYSFPEAFRVSAIRTYHNASSIGLNVEIWAVVEPGTDNERIVNLLPGRVLEESDLDTWQTFSIGNLYVEAGSTIDLIKVIRPSTGSVTFTHTWTYEGATGDPTSGRIYHQRGVALNEMRVHCVDNGGTDRSAELDNIGPGSTITMATSSYIWEVISASNDGTIYTFIVDPGASASNATSDFTFLYIAPMPINYVYVTDLFAASEHVAGYFSSEYLPNEAAYLNNNGYGLDIEVQNMVASADWDVLAYPPSGSYSTGGGGSGTGGDAIDIAVDATNFDGILGPTNLNVQSCLDIIDDHTHTEADITDLDKYTQSQVNSIADAKAPVVHTHTESEITDLDKYTQSEVDTLLTGKSDTGHTHTQSEITDFAHTHTESEITDLDKYTTAEVDGLLDGKADLVHDHAQRVLDLPADGEWSGTAVNMTVATDGGAFGLMYVNASGQLAPADADADTTMPGMFLQLAAGTGAQPVLKDGFVTNSGWAWTPGGILYASNTTGGLTQTPPSGVGDQVQTVGQAITATTIHFKPDLVIAEIGIFGV